MNQNNNNSDDELGYKVRETKSRYDSLKEQIDYQRQQGNHKVANLLVQELDKLRGFVISRD
jgi:hypothetical protein